MGNPIVNIKGRARGFEVTLVEHQEVFVLVPKTLDDMRLAFRKVPDITLVQDLVLVTTEFINGTDSDLACVYVAPFSL